MMFIVISTMNLSSISEYSVNEWRIQLIIYNNIIPQAHTKNEKIDIKIRY